MRKISLITLFLLSIIPFFIHNDYNNGKIHVNENYDQKLNRIQDLHSLENYIDSTYQNEVKQHSKQTYVFHAEKILKDKFYHKQANYSLNENWILYLVGTYFWDHVFAILSPDDIIKKNHGICSQQAVVFMYLLKSKNIPFRAILLGDNKGGHFVVEIKYGSNWHYHDVNLEPNWEKIEKNHRNLSTKYYFNHKDELEKIYQGKLDKQLFNAIFSKFRYEQVNFIPGQRMLLLQNISFFIVYLSPLIIFLMLIRTILKRK